MELYPFFGIEAIWDTKIFQIHEIRTLMNIKKLFWYLNDGFVKEKCMR